MTIYNLFIYSEIKVKQVNENCLLDIKNSSLEIFPSKVLKKICEKKIEDIFFF